MKKIIKEFWILAILLSVALSGYAFDFEVNGIYYTKYSDGKTVYITYKTTSYNSYSGSVVIPSTVTYSGKTYSVTSIGSDAFSDCYGLTSVTIPNSVTSIGQSAFVRCSGLTSVTIPNSVTSIGSSAFYNCSRLTKVEISDTSAWCNISFGNYSANPLYYAHHLYQNGKEVTNLVIPNSVPSIGSYTFYGCSGLTSVTIPNSVTSIGNSAFYWCKGLTSVTIGNSVTTIGYEAFCGCSGLTSVTIPNSVTSIGDAAFSKCSGLTSVTIGNSVTEIGGSAFSDCSKLTSVTIPNSVTSIGGYAFKGCIGLTSVTIPNSVTSIGGSAFRECSGLTSVTIGNSVTSIGSYAFSGCSGLTSVTIGNSVTSIGNYAFSYCSGLTSVTIGNSVTSIGGSAFYGCSGLTSVTIGNSVTSIGGSAFYGCRGLTSVTIPNSVTSIGENAFMECGGLTSVTIGNSVSSIGGLAFESCRGLTSVVFNAENCTSMGSSDYPVFLGCYNLTSLTIGENVKTIPDYAFKECSGLTSVTIPNSVTSIGQYAFSGCSGLTSVTIPNSVTEIGQYAFSSCSSLSILKWNVIAHPDFSSSVFPNSPLTSVVIGDEVVSVPNNLCKDITTINQVSIGKKVETIGNNSFSGCTGIETITWKPINYTGKLPLPSTISPTQFSFGNAVETIPENLCYGYSKITSITLPTTVKTIGDMAFFGCNLTKVTCRAALPPTMLETTFSQSAYDNATLYVYANSEDYYRDDEIWQNFYNVQTLSGGTVIEPVQLSVLFPDRGKVKIAVPYNKTVTLTVLPNDIAGFGLSSATFNGVEIIDELDENYQYTTPVLTEDAVLSVVYVNVDGGVDQSLANRIKVSASNGTVRVHGAAPESEVLVCDLSGKIVRKSTEKTFTLGEGIYVLNVEGLSFKFAM